jgi:isoeugenol monooxygenase
MTQTLDETTTQSLDQPGHVTAFPRTRSFTGLARPGRVECDVFELEYDGTLPRDLNIGFYRCGPDPQFPPRMGDDIYVNGDGMVSLFRIANGHVDLKMRYVRTDKFIRERAARRALFGAYRNPYTDDDSVAGVDRSTANTSVLWHGGKLFALKEDGLPHVLDPLTLETLGKWDFDGALRSRTFTAHPKIDPLSGELLFFGYSAKGDEIASDIAFCSATANGALTREQWFLPPYQSMIHDWGVTEEHVIFPIMPLAADAERLRAGGPRWDWDPSKPTHIVVIPRAGSVEDMRIFEGPPSFSFHTMNAFTEGSRVHLDLNVGEQPPFPDADGNNPPPEKTAQYLTRWTCDLSASSSEFESRRLWSEMATDFTDPDPRLLSRPYRYGFMAGRDTSRPENSELAKGIYFNTVARIDHETGEVASWYAGDDVSIQEPLFVPRSSTAEEGEGYVLTVANHWPEQLSEMLVFDARAIAGGPIATVHVPLFQRPVFHSALVPGADLEAL